MPDPRGQRRRGHPLTRRFQQSPVIWTTGGESQHALAVRATLDAFAGPQAGKR
jgi:hypothetical protein